MEIEELDILLDRLNLCLNLASVVCGLIVVAVIFGCMCVSYEIMDRVSIRFTLAISIVDVLKALTILFYTEYREDGAICSAISFSIYYFTLAYLFLNVAVALNLQLVFIHGMVFGKERLMWAVSLGLPLLLLAPPLFAGRLGITDEGGFVRCEIQHPMKQMSTSSLALLFGAFFPSYTVRLLLQWSTCSCTRRRL
ncbi:hypothetical protein DSO57_1005262 [Entomophthora muscae]|uniref:Uncharacterized protein n=1 Tax=Entomophthora muscae TaxID=34485 RepID=A0ACC2SX81_9FUNG|nr:hypothetical protein DSO57_1005262 [Entomophthora muscae]